MTERLLKVAVSKIDTTIFFYNPNIHPQEEYELRKEENIRFAEKLGTDKVCQLLAAGLVCPKITLVSSTINLTATLLNLFVVETENHSTQRK